MRRLLAVSVLAATLALGASTADAQQEGAVAVCNWDNFTQYGHDGYNWRWMGCNYSLFGRVQCRGRSIPDCWTPTEAKRDVRAYRAYMGLR
jgi:opacity protein-like surface antigen